MRILIAGSGYVGNALASKLLAAGDDVVTLNRSDAAPHDAEHVRADLTVPRDLSALRGDFDGVAYTVGPDESTESGYERAYLIGLRNLLASDALRAEASRRARVVLTTSTAVYGQTDGEWVDEASETTPPDFRGRRLLEAEHHLRAWSANTTSVRFGGIYGPGRHRLVTSIKNGDPSVSLGVNGPFINRLHPDDCAGLLAHLLKMPVPPNVLVGADDEPATANTVKAFVADALGIVLPRDESTPSDQDGQPRRGGKRCRNTKLHETGYELLYPTYRDGYGALLASQEP